MTIKNLSSFFSTGHQKDIIINEFIHEGSIFITTYFTAYILCLYYVLHILKAFMFCSQTEGNNSNQKPNSVNSMSQRSETAIVQQCLNVSYDNEEILG